MIRQSTIVKLAITALIIKAVVFLLSTNNNTIDDGTTTSSVAPAEYEFFQPDQIIYNEELDYKEEWTPRIGEQLGLTKKEYRVKRRQYNWRLRKQEGGLASLYLFSDELQSEDDDVALQDNYQGGRYNDADSHNIPTAMGYYNLSCPFEWYKYSCAFMQENEFDEQVTAASMQYYQQNLAEIWSAFDSVFTVQSNTPQPKRIFMVGDSLLRQLFISVACNAFSLNAVERSEVQWREEWPCPPGVTNCVIRGGQHSGFDAASIRFTNGMEIHFVPHRGFAYADMSKGEPEVLERMKEQLDDMGRIGFGTKTAFRPSGPMDVLVYNVGAHFSLSESSKILSYFASEIATPLMMKNERRPKIVYVMTPSQHFNTDNGQYKQHRMDEEKSKCVERVASNPRAELEKRILKEGVNVDVLLDYDDLELGALHVQNGDCAHYCMPGAADLVAARLLESL
jgi:hypothetical protein